MLSADFFTNSAKSRCSFRRVALESTKTTWFSVSYREWLREGPVEATATGRTFAMLVLTPPGFAGRDKIVRRTSLVLFLSQDTCHCCDVTPQTRCARLRAWSISSPAGRELFS